MDPVTLSILTSSIFGGLGGLFGGGGEGREPFDSPDLNPTVLLDRLRNLSEGTIEGFTDRISKPVRLRSSFAQTPQTLTGGGLPFPMGFTGVDPALADPSLLEMPGVDILGHMRNWEQRPRGGQALPMGTGNPAQLRKPFDSAGAPPENEAYPVQPNRPALSEDDQIALRLLGMDKHKGI